MSTLSYVKSFPEFAQDDRPVASIFYSGSTLEDSRIIFTSGTYIYQIKGLQDLANTTKPQLSAEFIFDASTLFGNNKVNQSTYKIVQSGSNLYFFGRYTDPTNVSNPVRLSFKFNIESYEAEDITPSFGTSLSSTRAAYDAVVYGDYIYVVGDFATATTDPGPPLGTSYIPTYFSRINVSNDTWENPVFSGNNPVGLGFNNIARTIVFFREEDNYKNLLLIGGDFTTFAKLGSTAARNKICKYNFDTKDTEEFSIASITNVQKIFFPFASQTNFLYLYTTNNFYYSEYKGSGTYDVQSALSKAQFDSIILNYKPYITTTYGDDKLLHVSKSFDSPIYLYEETIDHNNTVSNKISGLHAKRLSSNTSWFISDAVSLHPHISEAVFLYGHFEVANDFNKATTLAFYVNNSFIYLPNLPPVDYTINRYETVNTEYSKSVDQIPFNLNVPGPVSLRGKNKPYTLKIG